MPHRKENSDIAKWRTLIAAAAAKIIAEDGVRDYSQAKRKALHSLNLPENALLPDDREVDEQLRIYQCLYQNEEQRLRITYLREKACEIMEKLEQFKPYLTGSVLDGTAGRYSQIDIQLFPDSAKEVEIFLLNNQVEYSHSVPRSERAEAVLTVPYEDATVNLVIYPHHDERVTFRTRDGRVRHRMRTEKLKKLIAEPFVDIGD